MAAKRPPRIASAWDDLPQIAQIYTEAAVGDDLPQIAQIYTDSLGAEDSSGGILASAVAKCIPQIAQNSQKLLLGMTSHRFHRFAQKLLISGGALVSSAPTWLHWCTSCSVGALETSAPP